MPEVVALREITSIRIKLNENMRDFCNRLLLGLEELSGLKTLQAVYLLQSLPKRFLDKVKFYRGIKFDSFVKECITLQERFGRFNETNYASKNNVSFI